MYNSKLQTFDRRGKIQRKKNQDYIMGKVREDEADDAKQFNLVNTLIEAGSAWVMSGGNPLAAAAAGATARTGDTKPLQSLIGGGSKGFGVKALAKAGGEKAGGDLLQRVSALAEGAKKDPLQAINTVESFDNEKSKSALQSTLKSEKDKKALESKLGFKEREMKVKEKKADSDMLQAKTKAKDKEKELEKVKTQYDMMVEALDNSQMEIKLHVDSIKNKVPDLTGKSEKSIKKIQDQQMKAARDYLNAWTSPDMETGKSYIDQLTEALKASGVPKEYVKQYESKLKRFVTERQMELGL